MDAKGFELLMAAKTLDKGGGMPMDAKGFEWLMASKILGKGSRGKIEELEGVPPLTFTANGQPLLDYLISGNTVQNGTPTPEAPVGVVGCGERTKNLVDFEAWLTRENVPYTKEGNIYTITGLLNKLLNPWYFSDTDIYVSISGVMTIPTGSNIRIYIVKRDGTISGSIALGGNADIQKTVNVLGAGIKFDYASQGTCTVDSLMLNLGSTALPYEPYGYKLPLTSAEQGVDIYLGESQTTRRIKKLVLTGEEQWYFEAHVPNRTVCRMLVNANTYVVGFCSHIMWKSAYSETDYNRVVISAYGSESAMHMSIADIYLAEQTLSGFKSYLATQYSAGTPVTVWYVLATEETGIVNEPLMKIGDYTDTVSMEQAGVSITTNKGSTTLDVRTTVKPSNVYIKYKG